MQSHEPKEKNDPQNFIRRIAELREHFSHKNAPILAEHTATRYQKDESEGGGHFYFRYWGRQTLMSHPQGIAFDAQENRELPPVHQAMLLYYFNTANGIPLSAKWISFSELPDGRFYNQAFQGYSGNVLARHFGDHAKRFEAAVRKLNGERFQVGSMAFGFQILPRVPLLVVYWQGDEDFPSRYQILFDASARHYLPTDGYAILGSMLVGKLIAADEASKAS